MWSVEKTLYTLKKSPEYTIKSISSCIFMKERIFRQVFVVECENDPMYTQKEHCTSSKMHMGWLQSVGSLKLQVSFRSLLQNNVSLIEFFCKRTCNFKEPTYRSQSISTYISTEKSASFDRHSLWSGKKALYTLRMSHAYTLECISTYISL